MSHIIKIGRVVHYGHRPEDGCETADIVHVWGAQDVVNLLVKRKVISYEERHNPVYALTSVNHGTEPGQWHWPDECPYQL